MQKQVDKGLIPETKHKNADCTNDAAYDQLETENIANPLYIAFACELRTKYASSPKSTKDAEIKDKNKLIRNGHTGHLLRAEPPNHKVIQHANELRDTILDHHGHRNGKHHAVKGFAAHKRTQFHGSHPFLPKS